MSKNYFRTQLRKFKGGKEKKNRGKSSSPTSPDSSIPPSVSPTQIQVRRQSHGTDSPVHASPLVVSSQMPKPESSYSLASNASQTSLGTVPRVSISEEPLDRREIISITVDVQNFLAAISRLKKSMEEADSGGEDKGDDSNQAEEESDDSEDQSAITTNLKDLIQVVHSCLDQYQTMQSTEIKNAATELMTTFQNCDHMSASRCPACNSAVDMLIDAFTNSVQVFLNGDQQEPPPPLQKRLGGAGPSSSNLLKGFSKSHDNLVPRYSSYLDLTQQFNEPIVDEIDQALAGIENNVDVAARYVKLRTKYHREVASYLSKRGQIELRYHQEMLKLARKTHTAVADLKHQEESLPLVDLFLDSVDQDMRFASNCNTTYSVQVGSRVVEPLEQKIVENERVKKELTQTWHKELKKLTDARTSMKNAHAKYRFMGQDLARVKTMLSAEPHGKQAEKRKKEVVELETKWSEAETAYKNAVQVCNECQYQVHKSAQQSILCAYRRLVLDFDMVLRSKLETYFQLQHNFFLPIPDVMDSYLGAVQDYEIGSDFMHYIERHPKLKEEPEDYQFEEFNPEEEEMEPQSGVGSEMPRIRTSSSSDTFLSTEDLVRRVPSPQPMQAWGQEAKAGVSPRVGKNHDRARPNSMAFLLEPNAETKTPAGGRRNSDQQTTCLGDMLSSPSHTSEEPLMSKNALTHTFKRLRAPSRCRECDNYVYFNGYECEICGLACHKKCLKPLAIRCGSKRLDRKLTTFGVDFLKHLKMSKRNIPIIVTKCIKEIEERGLETHGLYRISTTKTKLEHLCQLFESGADRVDLSDRPPHLIASCLKLYFRQLPEPILTFDLYSDMLSFARDASYILPCNLATVSEEKEVTAMALLTRLRELLSHLDYKRYITLARLLYHLNRVSSPNHVRYNAMPASNLGIVYGPTLLRRRESVTPLSLLADMTAQAKAIEILISHVHDVFTTKEGEILREEEIDYEEGECIQERLVDGGFGPTESQTKSPETDMDDSYPVGSRTPFGTPPQRRRENISELGDVLEALQSAGLFPRSSQSGSQLPMSDIGSHPAVMSLPSVLSGSTTSTDDTLPAPRHLHHSTPMVANINKTLTPVDERVEDSTHKLCENEDEEEDHIIATSSRKFDLSQMSRSTSGLSNPSSAGVMGDMDSEAESIQEFDLESVSLFSGGDPPRPILASSSSIENVADRRETRSPEDYQEADENFRTAIMDILEKEKEQDSSQESSENYYEPMSSKNVQALLSRVRSPTSSSCPLYSSSDATPVPSVGSECTQKSTDSKTQAGVTKRFKTKQTEPSQLSQEGTVMSDQSPLFSPLGSWSQVTISNPSSPSAPQWNDDSTDKAAPQGSVYSTQSLDSVLAPPEYSTGSMREDEVHTSAEPQVHVGAQNGKFSPTPPQPTAEVLSMTGLLRSKPSHLWDSPRQSDSGIEESETTTSLQSSNGVGNVLDSEFQSSNTPKSRAFTTVFSSQGESSTKPSSQATSPTTRSDSTVAGLEEESEELVTTFDYESDDHSCDSEHSTPIPIAAHSTKGVSNGDNSNDEMAPVVSAENSRSMLGSTRSHMLSSRERKHSVPTYPSASSPGRKVSLPQPWHDKNRKIRINPLRVLKVTPSASDIPTPTEEYCSLDMGRARMVSPEEIAMDKPSDLLRRSKSCGVLERPTVISSSASLHTISEASETASSLCVTDNSVGSKVEMELSTDTNARKKGRREPQFV